MGKISELVIEINEQIAAIADSIEEGEDINVLNEYRALYGFSKELPDVVSQFQHYAMQETRDYKPEELKKAGFQRRSGSSWSFDKNTEVQQLKNELKLAKDDSKYLYSIIYDKVDESQIEIELKNRGCSLEELKQLAAIKSTNEQFFPIKRPNEITDGAGNVAYLNEQTGEYEY